MRNIIALCILVAISGTSVATAQTCGGGLFCNTSSDAYTITNNTGRGLVGEQGGVCSPNFSNIPAAGVVGGSVSNVGVAGYTHIGQAGVAGYNLNLPFCPAAPAVDGMLGVNRGGTLYGVFSDGNLGATGTKSFVEPHPTDASKEIRYVSLEGPEAGTYFRGSGRTVNGFATIDVPESFRMVTAAKGLTVVVTPTGGLTQIACVAKSLDKIVIQSAKDVTFDYMVNGVRKAFKDFQAISENDDFVPEGPDDQRFFTFPAESQRRLIATGIYTPEGKVNLEKAREMGWDRRWAERKAADALGLGAANR
jgi:hypothetical protein